MKWATLICLLLCTIVTESRHLQKRDTDHHSRLIGGIYSTIGKSNFDHLLLVMVAQNFQKCPLEDHLKAVEEISSFAQHCVNHEDEEECKKPMITIFHDKMCKHPGLADTYPWSVECCAKAEPEREKCFHVHRDIKEQTYEVPDLEVACKEHKENHDHAFKQYIDKIAKRHSLYPPLIVARAAHYDSVVTECCEAEDKPTCFRAKFSEVVKTTYYIEQQYKHVCHILTKFQERVYHAINIAYIAQKYPGASLDVVLKFANEDVHLMKDCCKGDVVECMIEGMEYTQHVCDDHEKFFAPNLKACCEKPLLERTPCIMDLPKEDIPADLPKELPKEFIEDEKVCQTFADHKDAHLAKFLYEFARRHPELSLVALLRVGKGYEGMLTKCCATENPVECNKAAPQLLADGIKETQDLEKQHCAAYEHLGPYGFNIQLLFLYVPKMPEVSDETLLEMTDKMTKFGGKCCALPENQRLICAEERLDILLGEMCERQETTFINEQVRHCCVDSYVYRRPCFTKLGPDQSYVPKVFDESSFKVGAEICEGSEEEQKKKRLKLLINVMRMKHNISQETLMGTVEEFTKVREKCCAAEDRQTCFDKERPAILQHLKEVLGH